ncbi:hypothetical protein CROQUDRAFT_658872 [Cronartium quercuum f. sp. fusiforme G11]|uniref:NADP-dependent oxidoreductase domain-containing protein n=1 Tax=Cronartium quercuum f. sp. fusiforme G11 TaxID=708437 RepID=A0A9P6TAK5_9BASI|nr:hypothetical protein CROQUDRAFT_658872 [Cronartium quercuum f. sp. fusiforme G11]
MASFNSTIPDLASDPPLPLSPIAFGAATFSTCYNDEATLESEVPEQTLLRALRSGLCNAIDTSPYYGNSQTILGSILSKPHVRAEFPRSSYHLLTKCGRYGARVQDFDYSSVRLRQSVNESCELMQTSYLDVVYLHDVEFVAESVGDANAGGQAEFTTNDEILSRRGLAADQVKVCWGPGDQVIIEAVKTLFELKAEGKIKKVGISGYPLPTLLRLSRLISVTLERPLDFLMSYAHHTLQNDALVSFVPAFRQAGVRQIVNASPLSMGLLRDVGPQDWHPAPPELRAASTEASRVCKEIYQTTLERVSLGFGFGGFDLEPTHCANRTVVIGCGNVQEVDESMTVWSELYGPISSAKDNTDQSMSTEQRLKQKSAEVDVRKVFVDAGFANWSWPTPLE